MSELAFDMALTLGSASGEPPTPAIPAFTSAPVINGTPTVGIATSYTSGAFSGTPNPSVTQQWTLEGVDIGGATGSTYTPVIGDIGGLLRVRQIATNSEGSDNETSAPVTVVDGASETFYILTRGGDTLVTRGGDTITYR